MGRAQRFLLIVILGIPALCCLGGILIVGGMQQNATTKFERDLKEARRIGMPTETADLPSPDSLPPETNAAPIYEEAIQIALPGSPDEMLLTQYASGESTSADPMIDRVLAKVEEASRKPNCLFKRDWSQGFWVEFRELRSLKTFGKALAQRAEDASKRGDWRSALKDLQTIERMAEHVSQEPIMISALVAISLEVIAQDRLRTIAWNHRQDGAFLEAALAMADRTPAPLSFRNIVGYEYVLGRIGLANLQGFSELNLWTGDGEPVEASPSERAVFQNAVVQANIQQRLLAEYLRTYQELPDDPGQLEETRQTMLEMERRVEADKSFVNTMNRILMLIWSRAADAAIRRQETRRMTQVSLRLFQDRLKTGRYPSDLSGHGERAIDPYSGKPFVYKLQPNGFLLYSVGMDREDNGGVRTTAGGGKDHIVTYPPKLRD